MSIEQPTLIDVARLPCQRVMHPAADLLDAANALEPTTAPWIVDVAENVGDNWPVAQMGYSSTAEEDYIITTGDVRASEVEGDAKTDAAWIVWCRNHWGDILDALELAVQHEAAKALAMWEGRRS